MLVSDLVLRTMRGYFVDLASSRVDVKLFGLQPTDATDEILKLIL